jgi:uncharacterized protein YndB with AHSA1/START domain
MIKLAVGVIGACTTVVERLAADEAYSPLSQRVLQKEVEVAAPATAVWRAWTTVEGVKSFFAQDAKIELRPGGAYEIYFSKDAPPGQRGAEGCTILTFLPDELLAFTWNAPPSIPSLREAEARTQVILELFADGSSRTKVRLSQHGFGEGRDWQEYYEYFDKAWARVLANLSNEIRGAPEQLQGPEKTWANGNVTVSRFAANKRQDFEIVVPATAREVWHVLTTSDGVRTFYPSNPVIELRPGGKWDLHGGKPNQVMAFTPDRMLAVTGSAPDRFPTVQKGGTWGIFRLEPADANSTRLRMSVVGWQEGKEWDEAFDYFLKANATFFEMIHRRFTEGPISPPKKGASTASEPAQKSPG